MQRTSKGRWRRPSDDHAARDHNGAATGGWAAFANGVISAIGLAFLSAMYASFAVGATSSGLIFGWINESRPSSLGRHLRRLVKEPDSGPGLAGAERHLATSDD